MTRILLGLAACAAALGCAADALDEEPKPRRDKACAIALAPHTGRNPLDVEIQRLQAQVSSANSPVPYLERLGWSFVAKARRSFDPGFYRLAEATANCMDRYVPESPEARLLMGHVLHQLHRFSDAEEVARALVRDRGAHFDHGLLGDVLMERGLVAEAAESYQRMMDERPGPQAYNRAAHLRWITGDVPGAIELTRMAVDAMGSRDTESAAWTYARLAHYELQLKQFEEAEEHARAALELETDYAPALLMRGRIELARGNADKAVAPLRKAVERVPLPEYQWLLAEALRASGRDHEATPIEAELLRAGASEDARTTALFLSTTGLDPERAWDLARAELELRRDVFTLDAAAWALYCMGRAEEAKPYMDEALSTGTRDPRLFLHAAAIEARAGDRVQAREHLTSASDLAHLLLPSEASWLGTVGANGV